MSKNSLIPKRRFKEFRNDRGWELRKFFDNINSITDFRGRTPKKLGMNWSKSGYLALSALNVKNGYIDPLVDAHYGNQELYDKWMHGNELYEGQVLFTTEAPMGNVAQVPDNNKYILSQRTIAFDVNSDKIINDFLAVLLRSPKSFNELSTVASGGTAKGVSQKTLSKFKVTVPTNLKEQKEIGIFFKQLDNIIALHQRKIEKLKSLKVAYLVEMFPAEGEKKPNRRFNGFTDNWELLKFNEVSDIYDGTHQTPQYQDEGVMFLSVENIKSLTSNKFISIDAFESEFKIRPQRGDVLMTRIGDIGTANVVETDEDLAYYVSLALFKSEKMNPYFLKASVHAPFVQGQIWKRTLHIAFPKKINKNEIGQVLVKVPKLEEQTKIGEFFQNLDSIIALHQHKLEKLQNLKKAYLNEMFV